jgi:ABC-type bacteriocin/lantibiotic exporter with double-glycine peptidase domain
MKVMRIPFYRQQNSFYCGPAIIQMAVGAFGTRITQKEAARRAGTTHTHGTKTAALVRALKSFGLRIEAGNNKNLSLLRRALTQGSIVVVCYTEPILEWGHYAIVKEFRGKNIILIDPDARTGKTSLRIEEFKKRWKDPLFTRSVRFAAIIRGPEPKK